MLFALFLILLFSSHIASLCAKKTGEIFICKFFNCAKADFKKKGIGFTFHFILPIWSGRQDILLGALF